MKTLFISISMAFLAATAVQAQEKLQSGDSVRVELEKQAISSELSLFRDSIQTSIEVFNKKIAKASTSKKAKIENSKKELADYLDLVKLDLQELKLTAVNAWTKDAALRLRSNLAARRKEVKRITTAI